MPAKLAAWSAVHPGVVALQPSDLNLPARANRSFDHVLRALVGNDDPRRPIEGSSAREMEITMPRETLPLQAADLSSFAKSLAEQLATSPHPPGHQSLLNMLARAAGHRNVQSLRAAALRPARRAASAPVPLPLTASARKALGQFDDRGALLRWPQKHAVQRLVLWVLWTHLDARRVYTEREINGLLNAWHLFGDPATLRRELIGMGLLTRKSDCSAYRKLPNRPTAEVRSLIQAWRRAPPAGVT